MTLSLLGSARAARTAVCVARVVLGAFWVHEGAFKYEAGFGRADINLVVSSVAGNARTPGYFKPFAAHVLGSFPGAFGVLMPLLEIGLGVALILGILPLLTGLGSLFQLMTYWSADQLIWQYPVMALLSGVVAAWHREAGTYTALTVLRRIRRAAD